MSEVTIRESCSCGATVDVTGGRYRHDRDARNPRGAEEIVERWRADHRHGNPQTPTSGPGAATRATEPRSQAAQEGSGPSQGLRRRILSDRCDDPECKWTGQETAGNDTRESK